MAEEDQPRLRAAIFDWAGTVVDCGCMAPVQAFVDAFVEAGGIEISTAEARAPMGLPKLDHVCAVAATPAVQARWRARHGRDFQDADARRIHDAFEPRLMAVAADYAEPIPGALDAIAALREHGLRIGSTTGYSRRIMDRLAPAAAARGYAPDAIVCTGDTPASRPGPLMVYRCLLDLAVWPAWCCVKVDDTAPGIAEGLSAGAWTVGLTLSGNDPGLDATELAALPEARRQAVSERVGEALRCVGAHYTIASVADLPAVVADIDQRLARGERP